MKSRLEGKRILVTRPKKQAGKLAHELEDRGAVPVLLSTTEIAEPEAYDPLDQALRNLVDFDWVIFTSANAVSAVSSRMHAIGVPVEAISSRKLGVVGPATAETLQSLFRDPDLMPTDYVAAGIARSLGDIAGQKFLLPRGDLARPELPMELSLQGATVLEVTAYRTIRTDDACTLRPEDRPDAITLASGEGTRATVAKLREAGLSSWLEEIPIACIGPVTAETILDEGYSPAVVAQEFTIAGLIDALERLFEEVPLNA